MENKKDLISIIIPIYNVEKYLDKCIQTIINQTYKNLEIILVDDGSNDKSLFICDKYSKKDNRITLIHKNNEGVSIARNVGVKQSSGKYIVFIDPDDYVSNDHIETLYNCIEVNNVDLVISNAIDVTEDGKIVNIKENKDFKMSKEQCIRELLSEANFSHVCWGNIYKRKLVENNEFDCRYRIAEDLDFLYRYISNIKNAYFLSKKTYYWLIRKGSVTNSQYNEKWEDELVICSLIVKDTANLKNDLYDYAIEKYIRCNFNQVQKFKLNKHQIKVFRRNIKSYKNEVFNGNRFKKVYKLKIVLFLKSYLLFKLTLNIKNKIRNLREVRGETRYE